MIKLSVLKSFANFGKKLQTMKENFLFLVVNSLCVVDLCQKIMKNHTIFICFSFICTRNVLSLQH